MYADQWDAKPQTKKPIKNLLIFGVAAIATGICIGLYSIPAFASGGCI
mgnify:CR=1 FL=1